ncbi:hypothetical protein C8Q73DRAFT_606160, partial [Cubamyces lactineus]
RGHYDDRQAFIGMLHTILQVEDRLRRGKKIMNIRYDASYDEICTNLALISPRAYTLLQAELGGRSLRSMQMVRAKHGKFKPGIDDANFDAAAEWAHNLGWTGPFVLSADDTKIVTALRSYNDG